MGFTFSIVTPSYNQGRFIERTLNSVLSQQFQGKLEYWVIDGGSTDETVEVLKRYKPGVEWHSERDRGQADAVNKGWARATGDIIGWLNSDDIYYPGTFAAVSAFFKSHPEVDVVYGDANHIDTEDRFLGQYPTEAWDTNRLLDTCFICQPAVFIRRGVLDRFGLLDVNLQYCLDYEYWLRLAAAGARVSWLRKTLAGSRLHPETKTISSRVKVHREINAMFRKHLRRVPDRWLYNYAHAVLDDHGTPRTAARFPLLVSAISLWGAFRWNRRVSADMWRMVNVWVGQGSKQLRSRESGK